MDKKTRIIKSNLKGRLQILEKELKNFHDTICIEEQEENNKEKKLKKKSDKLAKFNKELLRIHNNYNKQFIELMQNTFDIILPTDKNMIQESSRNMTRQPSSKNTAKQSSTPIRKYSKRKRNKVKYHHSSEEEFSDSDNELSPRPDNELSSRPDNELSPKSDKKVSPRLDNGLLVRLDNELSSSSDKRSLPSPDTKRSALYLSNEKLSFRPDKKLSPSSNTKRSLFGPSDDELSPRSDKELSPRSDKELSPRLNNELSPSPDNETSLNLNDEKYIISLPIFIKPLLRKKTVIKNIGEHIKKNKIKFKLISYMPNTKQGRYDIVEVFTKNEYLMTVNIRILSKFIYGMKVCADHLFDINDKKAKKLDKLLLAIFTRRDMGIIEKAITKSLNKKYNCEYDRKTVYEIFNKCKLKNTEKFDESLYNIISKDQNESLEILRSKIIY